MSAVADPNALYEQATVRPDAGTWKYAWKYELCTQARTYLRMSACMFADAHALHE